jgi:hypothetical protein
MTAKDDCPAVIMSASGPWIMKLETDATVPAPVTVSGTLPGTDVSVVAMVGW